MIRNRRVDASDIEIFRVTSNPLRTILNRKLIKILED